MKRVFTMSFIALAFISALGAYAPSVHALSVEPEEGLGGKIENQAAVDAAFAAPSPTQTPPGAGIPTNAELPRDYSYNSIMLAIMTLFAWLFGVAALLLDNVVFYTVVTMGKYVKELAPIGFVWTSLRDIANIVLIFGFLAAGISAIINYDVYGWGSKVIPTLLVGAVLINFSLFFSEAIIDTGNLVATQFYTQINGGVPAGVKPVSLSGINNEPIANALWNKLGLQTIYGAAKDPKVLENSWTIGFMACLVFLIAAFVMFSLAFILIARFVILIFLILTSPVGIVSFVIPNLRKFGSQWWEQLIQQTITAPVLLLLLYIALRLILAPSFLTGFGVGTNSGSNPWTGYVGEKDLTSFAGVFISFIVAMGLLLAVVVASKRIGAFGAGWATKTAGKFTFGATGLVGRSTVGWTGKKFATVARMTGLATVPILGTSITRGLDRVAKSSFDIRSTNALKNFPLGAIDAGTGQKGGYEADLKARIESRTKYAEGLTGWDLKPEQKAERARLQNEIQKLQKRMKQPGLTKEQIMDIDKDINKNYDEIAKIERWTEEGMKRKYASGLNFYTDPKNLFNRWINPASNTEAARKIRDSAKKGKQDKDLAATLKSAIEANAEAEETAATTTTGGGPTVGAAGGATPAGGTSPAGGGGATGGTGGAGTTTTTTT